MPIYLTVPEIPQSDKHAAGLERVALDLHVHSPASHDWKDQKATAEELVEAAIAAGLDGIAITDHQSGELVDEIKGAAKDKGLAAIASARQARASESV